MSIYNLNYDQIGRAVVLIVIFAVLTFLAYKLYTYIEKAVNRARNSKKQPIKRKSEDDFFFGEIKDIKHLR